MKPAHSEAQIQSAIVRYVRLAAKPGVMILHVPNGGGRSLIEGAMFKRMGTVAGCPDLLILGPKGQARFLEVKKPGGHLSPKQRLFIHELTTVCGCECAVVDSVEQAVSICQGWGVV